MKSVEKRLLSLLKKKEATEKKEISLHEFEQSVKEFQKLVEDGVVKPRGYNLQTIEDSYPTVLCNSSLIYEG